MAVNLWTREELILAFNLYLKLPFGKLHTRTPEIIELANLTGRTVNSIAIRLTNFASCDPYHQNRGVKGMIGGLKQCQPIWDEFSKNKEGLIFESENILAQKEHLTIETKFDDLLFDIKDLKGETKLREVKTRVNQNVFRQIVVANYSGKCAISGIDIPELLFASHIIPWSKNENERLNPENGICLSALYDKAFDKGFIGINENLDVLISTDLKKKNKHDYYLKYFSHLDKTKITVPQRYLPNKDFLQYHLDEIFEKRNI
ncbi:HNH endonuclease [Flavobacterium psychrophilum]|uniref:HNH endonuclease n=1 Tax=Flavobacterium psychrophilum TaxID=96345 RepID=UPI000B7C24DB|nr:HNH endonuclease [Flavobacterium psychrophilum]SNB35444.1 Restriction endonuclease [Flavobacterium psychrophilum]